MAPSLPGPERLRQRQFWPRRRGSHLQVFRKQILLYLADTLKPSTRELRKQSIEHSMNSMGLRFLGTR